MFDLSKPYSRVPSPDSGRILLVQGEHSLWEGYPPRDWIKTPDWARQLSDDTQPKAEIGERAAELSKKVASMKSKLSNVDESLKTAAKKKT